MLHHSGMDAAHPERRRSGAGGRLEAMHALAVLDDPRARAAARYALGDENATLKRTHWGSRTLPPEEPAAAPG